MNTHDKYALPPLPEPLCNLPTYCQNAIKQYTRYVLDDHLNKQEADRQRRGEPVLYTSQKALDLASRSDAVVSVGLTRVPQMSWNVPLYTAPQPAEPVTPRTHFEDARAQKVYEIICGDNHPPYGEHWDGYVSRLIVDALFPAEPVKPHLTVKYDDQGDYLYICCDSDEPTEAEENDQGILLWRAYSDGRLVGVTIPNFMGPMSSR